MKLDDSNRGEAPAQPDRSGVTSPRQKPSRRQARSRAGSYSLVSPKASSAGTGSPEGLILRVVLRRRSRSSRTFLRSNSIPPKKA